MAIEKKDIGVETTSYKSGTKPTHEGKLGDHPLGGAVGAAVGAVAGGVAVGAAQGAVAGTVAGLPGMVAGVAIGGVAGALAGKGAAQIINPTTEDAYWSNAYDKRDYVVPGDSYETYGPAYRHGIESYTRYEGRSYEEVEPEIEKDWKAKKDVDLPWDKARPASRDAYKRLYNRKEDFTEEDIDKDIGQ